MNINNNNISNLKNICNVSLNEIKNTEKSQSTNVENQKGIILPDIRSNQILLPDNKIYFTKGSMPINFNREKISMKIPVSYEKIGLFDEKGSDLTALAVDIYRKNLKISQYHDKNTGKNVIRGEKNYFSQNGVLNSREVMEIDLKKPSKATKIIEDYEHNTVTEIKLSQPLKKGKTITESVTTLYKDKNGKIVKTEAYTQSPVKGVYDITETNANGDKKIIAKTTKNDDGSYSIERHLTSLDGTKTEYMFKTDKDGNHKSMFCQITDANGAILSTIDRTYEKNGNTVKSTLNGNQYKSERNGKEVTIVDLTKKETAVLSSEQFAAAPETKEFIKMADAQKRNFSEENVTDKLFDTLPTDALFTLNKNISEIIPLEDDLDSAFVGTFNYLMCKTDNFVVSHELGHSKDAAKIPDGANLMDESILKELKKEVIADTENFRKAYVEEKAAFIKAFPDYKEKMISYFIFSPKDKIQRGRKETVAETNAINGLSPEEPSAIAMRTIVLQQYFPRTIAEATKLTNPIAMSENQQNIENKQ